MTCVESEIEDKYDKCNKLYIHVHVKGKIKYIINVCDKCDNQ